MNFSENFTDSSAKYLIPTQFPYDVVPNEIKTSSPLLKTLSAAAEDPTSIPKLCEYIKTLKTQAERNKLPMTRALATNCTNLTKLAVDNGDFELMELSSNAIRDAFTVTLNDHEQEKLEETPGRTTQCYTISVCLLNLYVKMRKPALAEGILKAINTYSVNIPPLENSPPEVQLQFLFYQGLINFLHHKYEVATSCFESALIACDFRLSSKQFKHLLAFLIPAKYVTTGQKPSPVICKRVPDLAAVYEPLIDAVRFGNYPEFKRLLEENSSLLQKNQLYLAFVAMIPKLRVNLVRRVWLLVGRHNRLFIPVIARAFTVAEFDRIYGTEIDTAEFYLAQHIADKSIRGYIHQGHSLLCLSSKSPFPNLMQPLNQ